MDIVDFERLEPSVYPSKNFVFEFFENYPAVFSSFATPGWVCRIFSIAEFMTKLEIRNNNANYCVCAVEILYSGLFARLSLGDRSVKYCIFPFFSSYLCRERGVRKRYKSTREREIEGKNDLMCAGET